MVFATAEAKSAGPGFELFTHGEYAVPLMVKLTQPEDDDPVALKPKDKMAIDWPAAWAFGLLAPPVSAELAGLMTNEALGKSNGTLLTEEDVKL